ncbi:MAG: CYTH domain-containing protein [Candidatus Niyogibacteria bacterium]|nr:CYTH domain-containing protein [Candidatus Niyogibacteria bacterium]
MIHLGTDPDVLSDAARVMLRRLDAPKRKTDIPVPPLIAEFFGMHKAGKDTQLVEVDRWAKRNGFNAFIERESAEADEIRRFPRDNPYVYEMRHFTYAFKALLDAFGSRDYHFVALNRGIVDTLVWLEVGRHQQKITEEAQAAAKQLILGGPWLASVDAFFYLTCSVEKALEREYGTTTGAIKYGSRMNPPMLALMHGCLESVYQELRETFPQLPICRIDTTKKTIADVRDEILSFLLSSAMERRRLEETDVLPWCGALLREKARMAGPEIKFRRAVSHDALRSNGWQMQGVTLEEDIFLKPRNQELQGNECFHLRRSGERWYFVYKREGADSRHWAKIHIPVSQEGAAEILEVFERVAVVKKRREIFTRDHFILNRDDVEGLGAFTEVKSSKPTDEDRLLRAARKLGLEDGDILPESYVNLQRKMAGAAPIAQAV